MQSAAADEADTPFDFKLPEEEFKHPVIPDFYRALPVVDRRIHVLGLGAHGQFIAHALRSIPNPPPVTLIHRGWHAYTLWENSKRRLQLVRDGSSESQEGFDAEIAFNRPRDRGKVISGQEETSDARSPAQDTTPQLQKEESTEPISSLIVCSQAPTTVTALLSVKHRLNKDSVVLFLQHGLMGVIEEVDREVFPDPESRPRYMLGVDTHGVRKTANDMYTSLYAHFGTMAIGLLPQERHDGFSPFSAPIRFDAKGLRPRATNYPIGSPADTPPLQRQSPWTPNDRYLLRTLLRIPALCAAGFAPSDLLQLQLEKLAMKCVIHPLTVMLDARNGGILYNYHLTRTMRLLLSEISLVIRSLPELQYIPNVANRFDPGRLETLVVSAAYHMRDEISPTLACVRSGRQTEIDYMNGWIVNKGEELGIRCLTNYMMTNLVKGKNKMVQLEMNEDVPFMGPKQGEGSIELKDGSSHDTNDGEQEDLGEL
ncbi:hypothetical protein K491DRAFT_670819 [Lophiostoma macrostomum CBS 122681]|uniref:2-dehydropantoate 2-reductase n=1 Tax=Lophiostoma macrostomum CBS 122681 TaxID=1314788 RepID=A0A6A6SPH8_9PLEO|nr:hypothetical protein K491DRAFT_670819 [Lophiostoma macrostomum CBS 122681]